MNKLYDRIDFENNNTPALNETNLNLMSKAIDDIDNRVIDIAGDVLVVVPEILDKYDDIEALATNPPYVGQNGHWWTWDTDTNQYVDSGVDAGVSVTVGTTTTLSAGSDATVTNSGTDTDPILNFGIPQGATGQNGQDGADGQDGVSPEVTITPITDGHTVTITDKDHPTGQSFNVMNGQDGAPGTGVPTGGTTDQVLAKNSNTDYDFKWVNQGGGSGGHTIINSAGTSMTQRTGLQFEGMGVTDDSTNDKTVVTLPTPDYVDEQYSSSTTYSKGMTCISGNKRYRYINSTASSGHQPPNATYWEVLSVASEISQKIEVIATLEGALTLHSSDNYKEKRLNLTASQFAPYKIISLVLYKPTQTQYGSYVPIVQTTELVSNFMTNDGNYHYVQACIDPSNSSSQYLAQLTQRSNEIFLDFLDFSKSLDKGKAVLYGIR